MDPQLETQMPTQAFQNQWQSEADTQAFAKALSQCPQLADAFIELRGNLGAGKTTLTRHLLRALGVSGRVKSPTYAIAESYELSTDVQGAFTAWHFDFYRFEHPREWLDAGFRDVFAAPGLKLVEWPDKARSPADTDSDGALPTCDLAIELSMVGDDGTAGEEALDRPRQVNLIAYSALGQSLIEGVR